MREDEMTTEQLLRLCAEDQALLVAIRERLPKQVIAMRSRGVSGQYIARETRIPETSIRRWFGRRTYFAAVTGQQGYPDEGAPAGPATVELSVDEYERLIDGHKQMVAKLRAQQEAGAR